MSHLLTTENLTALLTLTAMEIVLGIDNLIFVAILVSKLPAHLQKKARFIGLSMALVLRILLLLSIQWIMGLTEPVVEFMNLSFSGRDLILLGGGLFLVAKSTTEIHHKMTEFSQPQKAHAPTPKLKSSFKSVIIQVIMIDLVFSLDSVITAVGMAQSIAIMIIAVMISMGIMLWLSESISNFVERNPTIKILALSFLILIGVMLVAESMGVHVSKGYIYFAMAFSLIVELINLKLRKNT